MGFQALLAREDYYGVLKKTLQLYYQEKYGKDVYIGYEKRKGTKEMVMNPKLGMIYAPFPCKQIRAYIYKMYNIRNNLLKNVAAEFFVFLSTHSKSLFTLPRRLYIYPADLVNDSTIFSYLNRSIRIFDFKNNITVSIKKESFTSKFFDNQLEFRLNYLFEFVPKILHYRRNWFEEYILEGHSLARETDRLAYEEGQRTALRQMEVIQQATLQQVDAVGYLRSLVEQSRTLLEKAQRTKSITTYAATVEYINTLLSQLNIKGLQIPIAESHGDLQAGNVWLSKDRVWIIDWETHALRSVWFDAMTIKFGTRYYGGIKDLVANHQTEQDKMQILGAFETVLNIRQITRIFLLEDLLFNLEDMMELPSIGGCESFDGYMNDIISSGVIRYLTTG
jgi:thiamine kinase-like enzyme